MSAASGDLAIYTVDGTRVGPVSVKGIDVVFPDPSIKWTWILDARHEPYPALERNEVFRRAKTVRKKYVLIADAG
ncbi:MAG: hypothetical protein KGO50_16700 [Myxococcales bacterium]|jgi:hypothetical protein|nr:hypothetical protein [Myxococcales bacterium]